MLATEVVEGAGIAAGAIIGREEGLVGVVDLGKELVEVAEELVLHCGDVGDWRLAEDKGGVIVVSAGMLDEQQTGAHRYIRTVYHTSVEEGLEVVVTVMADVGGVEDGGDVGEGSWTVVAGFVVDDTDSFCAVRERYFVDPVNYPADIIDGQVSSFPKVLASLR